MSEFQDLYQEMIVDHSKAPRNFRIMTDFTHKTEGYNPLCGDKVTLYLKIEGETVKDVSFQGSGCAISTSSASLLTETIKGKSLKEASVIFKEFHDLLRGQSTESNSLGKLIVFNGVCEFPSRVKCASLVWHTLNSSLKEKKEIVSTESGND